MTWYTHIRCYVVMLILTVTRVLLNRQFTSSRALVPILTKSIRNPTSFFGHPRYLPRRRVAHCVKAPLSDVSFDARRHVLCPSSQCVAYLRPEDDLTDINISFIDRKRRDDLKNTGTHHLVLILGKQLSTLQR